MGHAKRIEGYPPELIQLMLKGGKERVCISFPQRKQATGLRAQMHHLRKLLWEADSPLYQECMGALIRVEGSDAEKPGRLILEPRREEAALAHALKHAGSLPSLSLQEPEPSLERVTRQTDERTAASIYGTGVEDES